MALKPINVAAVPQLFVCEKIQLIKCVSKPASFYLKYGNEEILLTSLSEDETENWLIKVILKKNLIRIFLVSNMFTSNGSS